MTVQVKSNGAYASIVGIKCKQLGAYNAVQGAYVKVAGAYQSVLGSIIPALPLRMILVAGQSLSIGTMTQASQPAYPAQPELSARMKTFNGVSPAGNTSGVTSDANTASLIQYQELTGPSGSAGYYTHGVGVLKYLDAVDDPAQDWLWAPAGVGGATITQIDSGGTYASYANQQKMLLRAKAINAATDVTAIMFSQGEANYGDVTTDIYYNKLVTYKANQLAAVAAQFPSSSPKFMIDQCGDGLASVRVHNAQANAAKNGLAVVVGPKYWLNRKYPNVAATEQLHLNVIGYTYQGEMFARALTSEIAGTPFKPTIANSVEYVDQTTIKLKCTTPNGGSLAIDTTTLPSCPGYGISVQRPDLVYITPTSVAISGTDITCTFAETIYPDYRINIGYTATDITVDGVASGNFMPLTNIRGAIANTSKTGLAAWYDWLMLDRLVIGKTSVGYVKPSTLGAELWRTVKIGTNDALAASVVFDGTNMTVTRNGVTNAPVTTVGFVDGGTNLDALYWFVKAGRTYRVSATCQVTSGAGLHEIRVTVGGAIIKRQSTNNGTLSTFTVDVTSTTDGNIMLQVNNVAIVGQISGISVKEVL